MVVVVSESEFLRWSSVVAVDLCRRLSVCPRVSVGESSSLVAVVYGCQSKGLEVPEVPCCNSNHHHHHHLRRTDSRMSWSWSWSLVGDSRTQGMAVVRHSHRRSRYSRSEVPVSDSTHSRVPLAPSRSVASCLPCSSS